MPQSRNLLQGRGPGGEVHDGMCEAKHLKCDAYHGFERWWRGPRVGVSCVDFVRGLVFGIFQSVSLRPGFRRGDREIEMFPMP